MPILTRSLVAESIGTLLLVFLSGGSIVVNAASAGTLGPIGIALAYGIGMAVIVSATMNISGGHVNPAVTAALWVARKIDARTAGAYVLAQLGGAVLGAALITAILPGSAVQATLAGTPHLGPSVTFMQGVWIEAALTFFLVTAVFGTAVSTEAPRIGGFGIGLAILVDALIGGNLTGAMMNPARAFGPAVIAHDMHGQAVYWIGPLLGAAVAGILWRAVLLPRAPSS
jgi:aquaporin Z